MASAVAAAAPLNPEIRLAQAVSELLADLSDEQRRSFRTQQENFSPPNATDVMIVVAEIDRVAARKKKVRLRAFGPRMANFLQAVQEFASLGDDVLGASVSLLSGSVWLIVRLTFMVCSFYKMCV
jgi:ankyrin repeat domain-containing protein 50